MKRAVLLSTSPFVPPTSPHTFHTTKPTGKGTGLGLSLSNEIIKAQGGELKEETKEVGGLVFIINLPVK